MFFRQLIDRDLGCACYVLGDEGHALVVDAGLDVDRVLAAAAEEGARVEAVIDTHIHADHVSGRALLADRTGADVYVPAGGGVEPGAGRELRAGDVIEVGAARVEAVAAPGHRPEHLAFLVREPSRSPEPWSLLTGDSLLVGDLARPDLAVDAGEGALLLHATLSRLTGLGDAIEVWPGHVGGSLCGGASLSSKTSSTIGYERTANPRLREPEPDRFSAGLIETLPPRPPTVEHVVARNRMARPARSEQPPTLDAAALAAALDRGAIPVDGRPADAFDRGHLAGAVNLPVTGRGLGTRAAWTVDVDAELVVLAADDGTAHELARRLRAVGLEGVVGVATLDHSDALAATAALSLAELADGPAGEGNGSTLAATAPLSLTDLASSLAEPRRGLTLVDVRGADEWRVGHVPGSIHIPLERLRAETPGLPDGPIAVACAAGNRAAFAASWLRRNGRDARRVSGGGIGDLEALGIGLRRA